MSVSYVSRSLQSLVLTIQYIVLTADVFQYNHWTFHFQCDSLESARIGVLDVDMHIDYIYDHMVERRV